MFQIGYKNMTAGQDITDPIGTISIFESTTGRVSVSLARKLKGAMRANIRQRKREFFHFRVRNAK